MKTSPRTFPGEARMHVSLAVSDVRRSAGFYRTLLDSEPVKLHDDYAKFEVGEPGLNLSLRAKADPSVPAGLHFGLELKVRARLDHEAHRLEQAGLVLRREESVDCCRARQDKFWVTDPDGYDWEVFLVLEDITG